MKYPTQLDLSCLNSPVSKVNIMDHEEPEFIQKNLICWQSNSIGFFKPQNTLTIIVIIINVVVVVVIISLLLMLVTVMGCEWDVVCDVEWRLRHIFWTRRDVWSRENSISLSACFYFQDLPLTPLQIMYRHIYNILMCYNGLRLHSHPLYIHSKRTEVHCE